MLDKQADLRKCCGPVPVEDDKFWDELMKDVTHPLPARLRDIPRGALRSLKEDKDSRQTLLEYDRFLDERAEDQVAEFK